MRARGTCRFKPLSATASCLDSCVKLPLPCIAASANQMISGSVVVFAAILSKLFLDRQLNKLHYVGCAWTAYGYR